MATSYNTLTLGSVEPVGRKSRAVAAVATALVLVGLAGTAAIYAGPSFGYARSANNVQYNAMDAPPVNCNKLSDTYTQDLPKWDPLFSTVADFYNACYYSFRCCTTTGNNNGCYVSNNFGDNCKGCLAQNGPREVRLPCKQWLAGENVEDNSSWNTNDLMNDSGVPETEIEIYAVNFADSTIGEKRQDGSIYKSCWSQGAGDAYADYADKCFEVLSWCNLLCPRDTPQTVDHVMCKHCTLFGFSADYFDAQNFENGLPLTDVNGAEQAAGVTLGLLP